MSSRSSTADSEQFKPPHPAQKRKNKRASSQVDSASSRAVSCSRCRIKKLACDRKAPVRAYLVSKQGWGTDWRLVVVLCLCCEGRGGLLLPDEPSSLVVSRTCLLLVVPQADVALPIVMPYPTPLLANYVPSSAVCRHSFRQPRTTNTP